MQSKMVLIIDDDSDIRELVSHILKMEGYETVTAKNGREAIDNLESMEHLPGLIILDLVMPIMNGWEFRTEQQSHAELSQIPVVISSTQDLLKTERTAIGAADFIDKPFELNQLLHTVKRFCA